MEPGRVARLPTGNNNGFGGRLPTRGDQHHGRPSGRCARTANCSATTSSAPHWNSCSGSRHRGDRAEALDACTPREWDKWLDANYDAASAIWLLLLKKNAPEPGMSYGEAVKIALCFGWIDSMARKYDDVPAFSGSARVNPAARGRRRMSNGYSACSMRDACASGDYARSRPRRLMVVGPAPSRPAHTRGRHRTSV